MNFVLDTNVLVAAVRSPAGASAELLRRTLQRHVPVLCSVPLFLEYEDVLSRPEHLAAAGAKLRDVQNLLDVLAGVIVPVTIQFLWRPQLRDPKDDLVLELAASPVVRLAAAGGRLGGSRGGAALGLRSSGGHQKSGQSQWRHLERRVLHDLKND